MIHRSQSQVARLTLSLRASTDRGRDAVARGQTSQLLTSLRPELIHNSTATRPVNDMRQTLGLVSSMNETAPR